MHFQKDQQRLIDGSSIIAQQINGAVQRMLISYIPILTQRQEYAAIATVAFTVIEKCPLCKRTTPWTRIQIRSGELNDLNMDSCSGRVYLRAIIFCVS